MTEQRIPEWMAGEEVHELGEGEDLYEWTAGDQRALVRFVKACKLDAINWRPAVLRRIRRSRRRHAQWVRRLKRAATLSRLADALSDGSDTRGSRAVRRSWRGAEGRTIVRGGDGRGVRSTDGAQGNHQMMVA